MIWFKKNENEIDFELYIEIQKSLRKIMCLELIKAT